MLAEKWVNNVFSVERNDHHCLKLSFLVGIIIVNVINCYAPQSGLLAKMRMPSTIKSLVSLQWYQLKRCYLLEEILMGMLVSTLQSLKLYMGVIVMVR